MKHKNDPIPLIWLIFIAVVIVILVDNVWASGPDVEATAKVGDQILKGDSSTSIGLAASLGDVDISGCVVTKQIGILVVFQRQNFEYDPWCLAEKLDGQGKHKDAAIMRCSEKETAKLYGDRCMEVMTFEPKAQDIVAEPVVVQVPELEEHQEKEEQHDDRLAALEARFDRANRIAEQQQREEQEYWAEQAEEIKAWK